MHKIGKVYVQLEKWKHYSLQNSLWIYISVVNMHENDKLQIQKRGYHWESKEESEFRELTGTPIIPITLFFLNWMVAIWMFII